ncbi:MAG: hypothetical protein Q9182_003647 [Xanthomendoza sp. 2 TL-2023]
MVHIKWYKLKKTGDEKPDMVYIESSGNSQPKVLGAECKIQDFDRAFLALNVINGQEWWGKPIAAILRTAKQERIFPAALSAVPTKDRRPRDLSEAYKISPGNVLGKNPRRPVRAKNTFARGCKKHTWSMKRSHPPPDLRLLDKQSPLTGQISTSSYPPFYWISDQRSPPHPYPLWAEPWVGCHWHMHYLDFGSDTTLVDDEETPAKKYCGPIIIDGPIEE